MNTWNNAIPGLTQGLQGLGAGIIAKLDKNDASSLYKGIGDNYNKIKDIQNKALDVIGSKGDLSVMDAPQYQQGGEIIDNTIPERTQQMQQNPNDLINSLYQDIAKKTGDLSANPYGKDYLPLIDKFYNPKPHYTTQFDKTNNMMITYDDMGNIIKSQRYAKEKLPDKKVKDFKLTDGTQFRQNEDGTWTAYNPDETGALQPTEYKLTDAEYQKAYGEQTTTTGRTTSRGSFRPRSVKQKVQVGKKTELFDENNKPAGFGYIDDNGDITDKEGNVLNNVHFAEDDNGKTKAVKSDYFATYGKTWKDDHDEMFSFEKNSKGYLNNDYWVNTQFDYNSLMDALGQGGFLDGNKSPAQQQALEEFINWKLGK